MMQTRLCPAMIRWNGMDMALGRGSLGDLGTRIPRRSAECFCYFFLFFPRKVMPYSRQRKAAKQVMQNLGDGTTPEGEGQAREVLGQSSTHVRRQNRTATAQGM